MEVSTFFTRLLQAPKPAAGPRPDALPDFEAAWSAVLATLTHPDERQLARGIAYSPVPRALKHITDALVYESNRTDEDTTGACLEYFLRHDMLAALERLCARDRPRGVKGESGERSERQAASVRASASVACSREQAGLRVEWEPESDS